MIEKKNFDFRVSYKGFTWQLICLNGILFMQNTIFSCHLAKSHKYYFKWLVFSYEIKYVFICFNLGWNSENLVIIFHILSSY